MTPRSGIFVLAIFLTILVGHSHASSFAPGDGASPLILFAESPFGAAHDQERGDGAGGGCQPITRDLSGGDCTVDALGIGGTTVVDRIDQDDSRAVASVGPSAEGYRPELRPPIRRS